MKQEPDLYTPSANHNNHQHSPCLLPNVHSTQTAVTQGRSQQMFTQWTHLWYCALLLLNLQYQKYIFIYSGQGSDPCSCEYVRGAILDVQQHRQCRTVYVSKAGATASSENHHNQDKLKSTS